jgi:acyl-coenzyme A thioesterase PaaI-like protein
MNILRTYESLSRFPLGKWFFSRLFCLKAPYFGTIRPYFAELGKGVCVVTMKKRWRVQNHLGTVHAIAMCNMAEAAAGLCTEVSVARELRWIPKKMEVEYLKKAGTHLTATCRIDSALLTAGERVVPVEVNDRAGETVFRARVTMYISPRKQAN